jgi:GNAT superfamily N-acetyltransferase
MPLVIQPLTSTHVRDVFDCGEPALNEYLRRYARRNEDRGLGRTFVAVRPDSPVVVGYYTLAAGSVKFDDIPEPVRRRLARYPVPVAHLARLATCKSVRGQRLGEALLLDALTRTIRVANEIGVIAMEVWAKTAPARDFYRTYGFEALTDDDLHLFLMLATAREILSR